jgi:uncharacterized protein (DUF169 family)
MRALPSSSRDLTLLLPEWMLFALLQMAHCRTLKMLAIGGQGSAGTRPEHRCKPGMDGGFTAAITQPASLSKDGRFFVQTMGSTSHCPEGLVTRVNKMNAH